MLRKSIVLIMIIVGCQLALFAEGDGYGENPGGAGGDTIVVENSTDLKTYASSSKPYVILIKGSIDVGSEVRVSSYKTLSGIDSVSTILGTINISGGTNNVVVKNLNISNPANDGITIREARYVYVTHCTVFDCGDGCIDVTVESDFVTISYCRFYYEDVLVHKFVNLIGASDDNITDRGKLHVTMHHNWWDRNCDCRMPRVRFGRVHMYNNYFSCEGNSYSTSARFEAEVFSENNYYEKVYDPFVVEEYGKAKSIGNVYDNCTRTIDDGNDSVFRPSYDYTLQSALIAREEALRSAGNRLANPVPPNPKKETTITWSNQSKIIYGTPLSDIQLCAKTNGNTSTPVYSSQPGDILPGGLMHTITVYFPEDENYKSACKTVSIEVAFEYFSLTVNLTNDALPGLVSVSPEATLLDGLNKFIKGTLVTLTASSNMVSVFDHWSDGDTNPVKTITIDNDTEITAHYKPVGYIVGWDFYADGNKSRIADFYSLEENKISTLELIHENGTISNWVLISGSNANKWFGKYAAVIGKSRIYAGKYSFQLRCNASHYKNIRVKASMLGVYTFYQVQNVDYSTDGTNFKTAGSIQLEQDSLWYTREIVLPDDASYCDSLLIRFKADNTSLLTTNGNDGTSISDIYIYADETDSDVQDVWLLNKKIIGKQYFTIDGRRVSRPAAGLYIERTVFNDGSTMVKKQIIQNNY